MEKERASTDGDALPMTPSEPQAKHQNARPNPQPEHGDEYITGLKLAVVTTTLTMIYFIVMLDNTILATAIPYITDDFHSLLDVGWYGGAYQLSSASLQPLTGKLYAKLGAKWPFLVCLLLFEIGSAICGAAQSSIMLIIGRAVAGMGGAGMMNGTLVILNASVAPHRQPALVGTLMGIGQLGIALGPLLGGAFTEYVTWRWCFYINLPIGGLMAIVLVFMHIPEKIAHTPWRHVVRNALIELDLVGFALFSPAVIQLFLAMQWGGNEFAWGSRQIIGLFCGAGATFIVWLVWNYRQGDNAMVPRSMMRVRVVWASCLNMLFLSTTVFAMAYYLPMYFQAVRAYSPFESGVNVLPNILSQMVFGILSGGLIQKVGYYTPFALVGTALNAIGCGLAGLFSPTTITSQWVGFQIIFGVGRGFAFIVPFLAIQGEHVLPKEQVAPATSIMVFLMNLGNAIMICVSQTIFTDGLRQLIPKNAPSVNPNVVIAAGSTAIGKVVPPEALAGVLRAYASSLDRVFYFTAGMAVPAFFFAWFLGFQPLNRKKTNDEESTLPTRPEAEAET